MKIMMNRPLVAALTLTFAAAHLAQPPEAAGQFSLEGRVGSSIPTGELTNEPGLNQTAGLSFALEGMLSLNDLVTAYAGGSRHAFNCDDCPTNVTTTGLNGGLKFILGSGQALPWARAGLMLHRASIEGADNDWGVGVDAGAGIDWLLTPQLAVVPALRVNSYGSGDLSLTYVTVDLGLHLHTGTGS